MWLAANEPQIGGGQCHACCLAPRTCSAAMSLASRGLAAPMISADSDEGSGVSSGFMACEWRRRR